jgi:hypothetical protein
MYLNVGARSMYGSRIVEHTSQSRTKLCQEKHDHHVQLVLFHRFYRTFTLTVWHESGLQILQSGMSFPSVNFSPLSSRVQVGQEAFPDSTT